MQNLDSKTATINDKPLESSLKKALQNSINLDFKTHKITQENYINIIFKNAKVGINFMFLLKDFLESNNFKNVNIYTDSLSIITLTPYLNSENYTLFCNDFLLTHKNIESKIPPKIILKKPRPAKLFLEYTGKWAYNFYQNAIAFFNFMGMFLYFFAHTILKPSNFKFKSLMYHLYEQGFKALPVSLGVTFIVGYAITLQGAYQLDSMGVPIMSVDTTAKLALREMGPFILALVIAGRSASSFTAELGSMRLTEELSAMQAMNLNIFYFLIIPRILALIIVMPLMVFAADAVSLLGGMIAIKYSINIGFEAYLERFYETVSLTHFWIGVVKAPFFGAIVGLVGCFRGLECKGDTQSIGRMTTISVVNAIFWIIMANAIFSFIFTRYNL
ncbi:MlaE family lipid ABC transporter permease subunit [Helicobacter saguini]|uniref:ABC transporter permease n=2 Tax=Helicobacter saguini TaxID=1548018 RepID=A0A347VZZ0_9HELI|nr:ABC transporter permease [Helicobacter saguini]MWV62966.1 MlaE family lipid ABC transporter permease subunit [Helicobacter saguini]MWV66364.1 MlaE family lipid ABC transporter permease subunit [Helicobacter saguini]MWV68717.1 MlaE family lipid ABC transporter permease subunit [Helicobacter saguini]MWV71732.1 MlaE family lipid ABC transporter permease subunit [Helicobacter saguini]TLD92184.1 ABC transporter permease [Helicobacter saguini]